MKTDCFKTDKLLFVLEKLFDSEDKYLQSVEFAPKLVDNHSTAS